MLIIGGNNMSFMPSKYQDGDYWFCNYYDTCVLDSGQTIKIVFEVETSSTKYYYNIYLVTMNKRKREDSTYMRSMGKGSLQGLLWAKKKVIEFESFIKSKHCVPVVIYCRWDDNRRRNAYAYGLKKIGYSFNMVFEKKALAKTIYPELA